MAKIIYPNQLRHCLQTLKRAKGQHPAYREALQDVAKLFNLEIGPSVEVNDVDYSIGDGRQRIPDDLQEL